jgi:RND superfamily putative drug exporter
MWSARHRWPVVALWFVCTIGLFVGSLAAGGTRTADAVSNDRSDTEVFESRRAFDVFDASGTVEEPHQFLLILNTPTGTIDDGVISAGLDDVLKRMSDLSTMVDGTKTTVFENLVDPRQAPPQAGVVSADKTSVRIPAQVSGDDATVEQKLAAVRPFLADAQAAHPALRIHALDGVLANEDIQELVNGGLDSSLRLTIPLTFLILLVAFGAAVAAFVPLVLAVTALLAAFGILGLYSEAVDPVSAYASQLIVLIGLAVAVDYSLFMVTRFGPSAAAGGEARRDQGGVGHGRSGGLLLRARGYLLDRRAVPAQRQPVPLDGRRHDRRRPHRGHRLADVPAGDAGHPRRQREPLAGAIPRPRPAGGSGVWAVVVRAVMRHPVVTFLVAAAVLIAIASPTARLHMGQSDFASFPDSIDSVQAVNLLNEKWPEGSTLTLQVVVTKADEADNAGTIERMTGAGPRDRRAQAAQEAVETTPSADGTEVLVSVCHCRWPERRAQSRDRPARCGATSYPTLSVTLGAKPW